MAEKCAQSCSGKIIWNPLTALGFLILVFEILTNVLYCLEADIKILASPPQHNTQYQSRVLSPELEELAVIVIFHVCVNK